MVLNGFCMIENYDTSFEICDRVSDVRIRILNHDPKTNEYERSNQHGTPHPESYAECLLICKPSQPTH